MRRRHASHPPATVIAGLTVAAGTATAIDRMRRRASHQQHCVRVRVQRPLLLQKLPRSGADCPQGCNPWDDMTQLALAVRVAICC